LGNRTKLHIFVVIPFGEPDKVEDARCHSYWGTGQTDVIPVGEPDKVEDARCHSYWGTGQTDVIPVGEPDKLMSFLLGNRTN
jgi:predicted NAD-dependent protein-ADP-ribosyltransferase YbiA (DUF1768 family)